jgi:hypothetical protein
MASFRVLALRIYRLYFLARMMRQYHKKFLRKSAINAALRTNRISTRRYL